MDTLKSSLRTSDITAFFGDCCQSRNSFQKSLQRQCSVFAKRSRQACLEHGYPDVEQAVRGVQEVLDTKNQLKTSGDERRIRLSQEVATLKEALRTPLSELEHRLTLSVKKAQLLKALYQTYVMCVGWTVHVDSPTIPPSSSPCCSESDATVTCHVTAAGCERRFSGELSRSAAPLELVRAVWQLCEQHSRQCDQCLGRERQQRPDVDNCQSNIPPPSPAPAITCPALCQDAVGRC